MLSRTARLRRPQDFAAVFKKGSRAARGGVVIHWLTRSADAPVVTARAGFVVSKKVGNAVVRNRVKRRLRAIIASSMPNWPGTVDVVVRATPRAADLNWLQLRRDVHSALDRAMEKDGRGHSRGGKGR